MSTPLTFEYAHRVLNYDPDTGKFHWKARPESAFRIILSYRRWEALYAGREAFVSDGGHGHKAGEINGKRYLAHRVAWLMHYGAWPAGDVDHDGDGGNNRLINLRDVSHQENMWNQKMRKNNTSGVTGVYATKSGKWMAHIKVDGRLITLGTFQEKDEAIRSRLEANEKYGFSARHGTSVTA